MDFAPPVDLRIAPHQILPQGFYPVVQDALADHRLWDRKSLIRHLDELHERVLFLGRAYFKSDIAEPDDERMDPPPHATPAQVLGLVLYAMPVHRRRALYAKALNDAIQEYPENNVLRREARMFNDALVLDLASSRVLGKGSQVVPETDSRGITHWSWFGPLPPDGAEPWINALGAARVPVYRLLWPLELPGSPIPVGKIPVRDTSICTSDFEHPCVRPSHFRVAMPPPLASQPLLLKSGNVSRQRNLSGIPSYKVRWHWGEHGGEDPDKVYCSVRHHLLPELAQDKAELRALKRRVYCGQCRRTNIYEATHPEESGYHSQWAREAAAQIMEGVREEGVALPAPAPEPAPTKERPYKVTI